MKTPSKYLTSLVLFTSLTAPGWSATIPVTSSADNTGPGTLRTAINSVNNGTDTSNTINIHVTSPITLGSNLFAVVPTAALYTSTTIANTGSPLTITGAFQPFFAYQGKKVTSLVPSLSLELKQEVVQVDQAGLAEAVELEWEEASLSGGRREYGYDQQYDLYE